MKRLLTILAACLLLASPVVAKADTAPPLYTQITTTSVVVVKAQPGIFYGIQSTATQANAFVCYDNASAASGVPLYTASATMAAQFTQLFPLGIQAVNGITCQIPTAIAGSIFVYWR